MRAQGGHERMRAHALEPSIHVHLCARECMHAALWRGRRELCEETEETCDMRQVALGSRAPRVMCVRAHVAGTCVGSRVFRSRRVSSSLGATPRL